MSDQPPSASRLDDADGFKSAELAWLKFRASSTNLPYPSRAELAAFHDGFSAAFVASHSEQGTRTYLDGIEDAAAYLKGGTFREDHIGIVDSCLALLKRFHEQGGFSKWPKPNERKEP